MTQVRRILHELRVSRGKEEVAAGASKSAAVRGVLIRGGDAQRFQFAVEVAAFEAQGGGGLRHIPAVLLKFPQDEFPFIGTARFMERRVGMVRAFRSAAKEFGRQVMRFDARLGAHDHQSLDEIPQLSHISWPGVSSENLQGRVAELASLFPVTRAELS